MRQRILKLIACALVGIGAQSVAKATTPYYQIPNGDFEMAWTDAHEPGGGFHSFGVSTSKDGEDGTVGKSLRKNIDVQCNRVEGRNGGWCVRITSLYMKVIFVEACPNGNLTTGNIYGGAASAADKNNHNKTIRGNEETSFMLAVFPDSVSFWYKFAPGYKFSGGKTNTKNVEPARCQVYVHGDIDFRDQEDQFSAANVTKYQYSKNNIFMAESAEWKYCAEALTYTKSTEGVNEDIYLLMSFATNATPSGSYDDNLWVDDVKLIYSSKLEEASFGIVPVEGFDKDVYSYEVMFEADTDLEAMAKAANVKIVGKSAKYTTSYNSADAVFTVTVEGADISVNPTNKHTYTFKFKKKAPKLPEIINTGRYTDNLVSFVGGGKTVNTKGEAQVDFYDNYYSVLTIKDAVVDGEKVGDIVVDSLPYKIGKDSVRLSGKRNATVGAKTMSVEVASAASSLDYKKLTAILNAGNTKITYGYVPPVDTLLSETREHWLLTFVKGEGRDTVRKSMTMRFMENGLAMIQIPAVKIGATTFGDLTIDSIPYTEKDGEYDLKGDGVATYKSNLSAAMGVRLGRRIYGVEAKMTADTMIADIVFDVTGMTLGNDVAAEFGKYVHKILPKVDRRQKYTDYLIVSDANGSTEPVMTNVTVDYYDNAFVAVDFGEVTLPNGEKVTVRIDSVGYDATDSVYMSGRRDVEVAGLGVLDFNVEGANNISYLKLRVIATSGSLALNFGTYESPTFDTLKIKALEMTDNLAIVMNKTLYNNEVLQQKVYVDFYNTEKADLYIKDFYLDGVLMGDLAVKQVPYTMKGDSLYMEAEMIAEFTSEDTAAMGPWLDPIPLKLKASVSTNYDKMTADLVCDFANTEVFVTFGKRVLLRTAKYTDNFEMTVNGTKGEVTQESIIIDYFDNNTARLSILGFKVGELLVGDIVVDGFEYEKTDSIRISGEQTTEIKSDDVSAIGPSLGEVPVNLVSASSSIGYKKLKAFIEIDMTETMRQVVDIRFGYPIVPDPVVFASGAFKDTLVLTVDGEEQEPVMGEMKVEFYDNLLAVLTIPNVVINDTLYGDLMVDSLPFTLDDTLRINGKRVAEFVSEDKAALASLLGGVPVEVEEVVTWGNLEKLYAKVNIDLSESVEKEVRVVFGYDVKKDTTPIDTVPEVVVLKEVVYNDTMVVYVGATAKDTLAQEVSAKFMSDSTVVMVVPNVRMDGQLLGDMTLDKLVFAEEGDSLLVSGEQTVAFASTVGASLGSVGVKVNGKVGKDFEGLRAKFNLDVKSQIVKVTLDYGVEIVEEEIPVVPEVTVVKDAIYTDNMVIKVEGEKNSEETKSVKVTYYSDGSAVMTVPSFVVAMGGDETVIDSFVLSELTYTKDKDSIRISGSEKIEIKSEGVMIANETVSIESAASSLNYSKIKADLSATLAGLGIRIDIEFGHKVLTPPTPGMTFTVPDKVVYSDSLVIAVDGDATEPMLQDIIVDYAADGTCTLSIINFTMGSGADAIEVGDVIVSGLAYSIDSDSVRISGEKVITIDSEMGAMIGEIPVAINSATSSLDKQKLECNIGIDMSATLGQVLEVTFGYTELHRTPLTPTIKFTVPDDVVYTDSLVIAVDGDATEPMLQDITVEYAEDGTCTLSIINFTMGSGADAIEVGDVIVSGLAYSIDSDSVRISGEKVITIDSEMGAMIGEIPVVINSASSSLDKKKLECNIGIDMSATLGQVLIVTFGYTSLNRNPIIPSDPVNDVIDTVIINDSMYIYVNGEICSEDDNDVKLIVYSNGTMDLTLYNVHTKDEDGLVLLGNAKITGIKYTVDDFGDYTLLPTHAVVAFGSSDSTAVGPYLGELSCSLDRGVLNRTHDRLTFRSTFTINKRHVVIAFGEQVDAKIETVVSDAQEGDGSVYSVSGVYYGRNVDVNSLPKGMYIIGGKKVYVRK